MKIKDILLQGSTILRENNIADSNLKSRIVLADLLNKNKEYLMIYDNKDIDDNIKKLFFEKIERLKKSEPIQYIINKQEFMGFELYVDKNVLIPQPDTENLVEEVISISKKIAKNELKILDLCTGSGAIAIAISKFIDNSSVFASDISKKALEIAEKNSNKNNTTIIFFESDLFKEISSLHKFDIIISNPPYIEAKTIDNLSEEVKNEPIIALDGGQDGLEFYKRIIKDSKKYLNKDGYLAFEIGYNQRKAVEKIFKENNYKNIYSKKDLAGNDRVVIAQI